MKPIGWVAVFVLSANLAIKTAEAAGCRPFPHGPYGGPCYACGGRGYARGYQAGYYGFGSWGYPPGYAIGNYGYSQGFGQGPSYGNSNVPGYSWGYNDDRGYCDGYYSGRGYGLATWRGYAPAVGYFASGGYIGRWPAAPRDLGGDYGGILPDDFYVNASQGRASSTSQR